MATPKEEKLLASIDGTLKDILKELKKHNRDYTMTEQELEALKRTRVLHL